MKTSPKYTKIKKKNRKIVKNIIFKEDLFTGRECKNNENPGSNQLLGSDS